MSEFPSTLGVAVLVFASTNIDDIVLLAAFFADPNLKMRTVVGGQFLGIGILVLASALMGFVALAVPEGLTALLGVVPLVIGLRGVFQQLLTVTGVTLANGGDNLGVYIPLFASAPATIPVYVAVFAGMTALWCAAGYALVKNRVMGHHLQRLGRVSLPFVLVALGLWILAGARVLVA